MTSLIDKMDWKSALIEVGAEVTTHQDADAFPRSFTFNEAQLLAFLALAKAEEAVVGDWEGEFTSSFLDVDGDWHKTTPDHIRFFITTLLAAKDRERERIEQAHMAGYHSCCKRDSSYSDARNYFEALTPPTK